VAKHPHEDFLNDFFTKSSTVQMGATIRPSHDGTASVSS
jgi:hypothetical protein